MTIDRLPFDPANHYKLVADTPEQIRRCDVFRLLDETRTIDRPALLAWLTHERPDLDAKVADCLPDLTP